jgi:SNF2 family DNA or RNA helicase
MVFENIPYTDGEGQRMYEFVKELVHIPPKHIEDVRLDFTADEMVNYQNLKQKGKIGDTVINANPLVFLLRLRQMTIHPWMVLPQDKFQEKIKSVQSVQTVEEANKKFVWSAKLKYLLNDINTNLRRNPNEKSLVFSQFTRALNLVELALRIQGWISESDYQNELRKYNKTNKRRPFEYENRLRYVRIDGSSSNEEREDAMRQLRNEPNVKLALLSLRAAGEGLNLISANNVYFLDLYFNPQVHAQAIDRTHRIGQEKVVKVKMIVINNTIEDEIRKLLNFKENLAKFTLKPPTISQDIVLKLLK